MKKALLALSFLVVSLVFSGCGAKKPFEPQQPLPKAALVYIYVVEGMSSLENESHATYQIRINDKPYLERIESGEHMVLNVKPNPTLFSAVKNQIIEEHVKLNLKEGDVNYIRITDNVSVGEFGFEQVSADVARSEIAKTGLAGSVLESADNMITELIGLEGDDDSTVSGSNKVPALTEAQIDAIIEKKLAQRAAANGTANKTVIAPANNSPFLPKLKGAKTNAKVSKSSKLAEIKEAYNMKEQGIISQDEFDALKADILAK